MNNLQQFSGGTRDGFEAVANIADAQRARDRIAEIADWVVTHVPWTVAVPDWHGFQDRWPLLSRAELAAVEEELCRRCEALHGDVAEIDGVAATLSGRQDYWTAAADWVTLHPRSDITNPEFFRLFSQLSRAEPLTFAG